MPEIPRTKFNSPWTVAVIEAALNDVSSAKGSSESLTAALNAMRAEINSLSGGVHLKGAVDYYSDLPASPSEGDAYTVLYQGTSGTDPLGIEYAWATYQGTPQWIPIGVDPSVFAKATDEAEDRAALAEIVDGGAKSLLNPEDTVSDKTLRGVTVTRTGDVYSFSGTAEDNTNIFININNDTTINNLPAGDYVAVFEQVQNDIKLQVGINGTITYTGEFGQPLFFTIPPTATSNWIRFFFVRLVNYNGRTARIMICTKAAWDISQTFQPYRPSWQEMYDMILALQSGGNRALMMQTLQPTESTEPEEQEER